MTIHILAVDPGLKTGVAAFSFENKEPTLLYTAELDMHELAPLVRSALEKYPDLHVVCEKFTITAQTAKLSQAPYSLELIGVLKQCMRDVGRSETEIAIQTPADAKAMWDNAKLKKVGLWHKGGAGHALDAIRHGALYMIKLGWNPLDKLRAE